MNTQKKPRQRRSVRTREAILDAARQIIMAEGVEALSMRTLAEAADYSPAALYRYFSSKEEIVEAIRQEGFALSNDLMERWFSAEGLSPLERLAGAGRAYLDFAATHPQHYRLMFDTSGIHPDTVAGVAGDPEFAGLIGFVQAAVDSGELRLVGGYTPATLAFHIWITVHGIAMLRLSVFRGQQSGLDTLVDQIFQSFMSFFQSG